MVQHLRQSQFVVTWGPGSILEGQKYPRLIPSPDIGLFTGNLRPDMFEISDQRMSLGLLNGNRIFRLPSNAELGIPHQNPLYRTRPFPEWKICHNTGRHAYKSLSGFSVLFTGRTCPRCGGNGEAVRFVMACPGGHLDDVDWLNAVHKNTAGCSGSGTVSWLVWEGGGSSLTRINITCPYCRATTNLGEIYQSSWPCSGRFPEREPLGSRPLRPECDRGARVVLRQASNLRIPEIRTLFTIPPRHTELHNLLQQPPIYHAILASPPASPKDLEIILFNLHKNGLVRKAVADKIIEHPWNEILQAIKDICDASSLTPGKYSDLLIEEFHAFINGSLNGIPPIKRPKPSSQVLIEIDPNLTVRIQGPNNTVFRITPVPRMRTVIVQTGYRREVDTHNPAEVVDVSFPDPLNPSTRWYPGVEFFGEGIFIMLDVLDGWQNAKLNGSSAGKWKEAYNNNTQTTYPGYVFRDSSSREELHPVFVWWHTLSHLLIRAISRESGYPSASIRERVYLERRDNGSVRGGILLYAVQPGSSGTMGGLISLVPHFRKIFDVAFKLLENCSGDPLCLDSMFFPGRYCGSACYGCLFLSETSCEHRNMWLDRRVLMDNIP